jgi:hypothetical protein
MSAWCMWVKQDMFVIVEWRWMVLVIVIGSIVIGDLARAVAFDLSLVILLMLCRRGICISPDTRCRGRHLTTTYRKCR